MSSGRRRSEVLSFAVAVLLIAAAFPASAANDELSLATVVGYAGELARLPVYIRDVGGTALDAGTAATVHEIAFSVSFTNHTAIEGCGETPAPNCVMTFTPAGVLAGLTPAQDQIAAGSDTFAIDFRYSEAIPLLLNAEPPGNLIGFIDMVIAEDAVAGTELAFAFDPAGDVTALRGNGGQPVESDGAGLALQGGSVKVGHCGTAPSSSGVGMSWSGTGCVPPDTSCFEGTLRLDAIPQEGYAFQDCDVVTWTVSDGSSLSGRSVTKSFAAGTYDVTMTVANELGTTAPVTRTFTFSPHPPPCAPPPTLGQMGFTAQCASSPGQCRAGEVITFRPAFIGYTRQACDTIQWNFGDGSSTTGNAPTHTYAGSGTFNVTMTVTNSQGTSPSFTVPLQIIPGGSGSCTRLPEPSQMSFTAECSSQESPCRVGEAVMFRASFFGYTPQLCDTIVWDFGDGTGSTGREQVHVYSHSGNFTVTMRVSNSLGLSQPASMTIEIGNPQNAVCRCIATVPASAHVNSAVTFTAEEACAQALYTWTFGDGVSLTGRTVTHAYPISSGFLWTLSVTSQFATPCETNGSITVVTPPPRRRSVRSGGASQ